MAKKHIFRAVSIVLIMGCVGVFLLASPAQAQVTDTQGFSVTVPSRMTITAPASASITHDETDSDQVFGAQQWAVKANARNGATVTFSTDHVFEHTVDPTFERDAKLDLAIASSAGPANWTLAVASDQTDYAASDEVATVQAGSTRPGQADFDLTATFITDVHDTLAAGDYTLTITGTLTAN